MGLKRNLGGFVLIISGLAAAILILEIGLHLMPEASFKKMVSRRPSSFILYQTDQNIGWVHVPDASLNWQHAREYNVDIEINSLGLRDYERSYEKPVDTFRILVLGDSFIEAIQVPLAQAITARLEQCLTERLGRRVEVINGGVSGYGPGDELLFFTQEGIKYQPDLVLSAIYIGNDVGNMAPNLDDSMIGAHGGYQFFLDDGQLKQQWVEWAEPNYALSPGEHFLRRYSRLYYIFQAPDSRVTHLIKDVEEYWGLSTATDQDDLDESGPADYVFDKSLMIFARDFPTNPLVPQEIRDLWELFKAPFRELKDRAEEINAPLAAVIIPRAAQVHEAILQEWVSKRFKGYTTLRREDWEVDAPNKATVQFLTEYGIPTLDLLPDFQAYDHTHNDSLYFASDGHFNEIGHQEAARLVCNWLIENELFQAPALTTLSQSVAYRQQ